MLTDKQTCQQAIFAYLLHIIAATGINKDQEKFIAVSHGAIEFFLKGKDQMKLARRLDRIARQVLSVARDAQTNKADAQKLVICLHGVVANLIERDFLIKQEIVDMFVPFLELEAEQDKTIDGKPITDADWLKLKQSADKLSQKVFLILNKELEYFNN